MLLLDFSGALKNRTESKREREESSLVNELYTSYSGSAYSNHSPLYMACALIMTFACAEVVLLHCHPCPLMDVYVSRGVNVVLSLITC